MIKKSIILSIKLLIGTIVFAGLIISGAVIFYLKGIPYLASNDKVVNYLEDVASKDTGEVPMHIRNAPIEDMRKLGYNEGYLYPHDFPGHWVEQQYLPDKMVGTKYYIKDENIPE